MLTVPEAARRIGRNPETIRRWIRAGRIHSHKVGTQHLIDEADLAVMTEGSTSLPVPVAWRVTRDGTPMPDWVAVVREVRESR